MTATILANAQPLALPEPNKQGGMPLAEALQARRSVREFDATREITPQQLSDLLWSACGVNRPYEEKRTNPTAMNSQEIDVYVFKADGVYYYDFRHHEIAKVADGDHRSLVAGNDDFSQPFVLDAPVSLVMIADLTRFERESPMNPKMAAMDAGIVSQNINLFCAANGLATVPRVTMDGAGITALLNLPATSVPLINNPVGYEKPADAPAPNAE